MLSFQTHCRETVVLLRPWKPALVPVARLVHTHLGKPGRVKDVVLGGAGEASVCRRQAGGRRLAPVAL